MTAKGLKRKFPAELEDIGPAWEHQRQSVLDISIEKFQRDLSLIEPSLRRSVLIANTLRQIQSEELRLPSDDLDEELVLPAKTLPPPPSVHHQSASQCVPCLYGAVQPSFAIATDSSATDDRDDAWMAASLEDEFSLSTAISSILKELDGDASQDNRQPCQAPQRTPLGSIENLPGGWNGRPRSCWSSVKDEECRRVLEESSLGPSCSPYLHEATYDSILLDMDMPMLDREVGAMGQRPLSPSSTPMVSNEELMRYLPSLPASSPVTLSAQGTKDIHELEHIMEILVES